VKIDIISAEETHPGTIQLAIAALRRASLTVAVASVLVLVMACGIVGDSSSDSPSPTGACPLTYPELPDGQYIDSLPAVGCVPVPKSRVALPQLAASADEIAVLEVSSIAGVVIPTAGPGSATPAKRANQPLPWTTYNVHVDQWIKGDGPTDTTVTTIGGIDYDGPRLYNGTFLLQAGRKYLMPLRATTPQTPGSAKYEGASTGWASFEVTDGFVHVLNDARAREQLGQYGGLKLSDIIPQVQQWIVSPPPPVTHSPAPATPAG
jgi:hypothetical protein